MGRTKLLLPKVKGLSLDEQIAILQHNTQILENERQNSGGLHGDERCS